MSLDLTQGKVAEVLLVEDNENDVLLTELGFKRLRFAVHLHHVENGRECMRFLRGEGEYAGSPMPDLILLDLNLPLMDGWEVMEKIAQDNTMNHIPVVVLTTSDQESDVLKLYKLRCSSYIVKPVDFDKFVKVIGDITEYWFTLVVLPPHQERLAGSDSA